MPRVNRSPRNSVNDRPAWLKLLLRRQKWLLKPVLVTGAAVVVAFVLVGFVQSAAPRGSIESFGQRLGNLIGVAGLRVRHIEIQGRANTPKPALLAALHVHKGEPIFGFSLGAARDRIENLSWVKEASVERRLPDTVVVNIQERRPFAIWQNNDKFLLIDRSGNVVAHQDVAAFRKLPLVVGPGAPEAAAALIDALNARPQLQRFVVAAVRVGQRRWNLLMTNGANVMLPEGHDIAALDRLMQLQQDHDLLNRPLLAIDMRLPDRLVVRVKSTDPASGSKSEKKKAT